MKQIPDSERENYLTMILAIKQAMDQAMEKDDDVVLIGQDIGKNGGVFRATEDLQDKYGTDRVNDTPLAESAIGGMAIGLANQGFRPVMEIQFLGFLFEAMDSLAGQMARIRYRTGGTVGMPIVVRAPFGGGVKTPELHPDNLEGLLAQIPGLKVVIPSSAVDAKGLLTAAINDNDPVFFLEHMLLYRSFREDVPKEEYEIELGKANVVGEGDDVTLVTYGAMVRFAMKVRERLEAEGVSVEVIDLRTVSPIDYDTITESIHKTKHVVVAQEAQRQAGVGNKVIAEISQRSIYDIMSPIEFVAAPDTNYPFTRLEDDWLPNEDDLYHAVKRTLDY